MRTYLNSKMKPLHFFTFTCTIWTFILMVNHVTNGAAVPKTSSCILEKNINITCQENTTLETFTDFIKTSIKNTTEIKHINLINCNIPSLPEAMFTNLNLTKLRTIEIRNCNLEKIHTKTFLELHSLTNLTIRDNDLRELQANQFTGMRDSLQFLDLDHNNIQLIPSFTFNGLNQLMYLILSNNNLTVLKQDFLQSSVYIEYLTLRNSNIKMIEKQAFGFISNLRIIDLSENQITHLNEGAFMGLNEIEVLNLSNLSIEYIAPKIFHPMQKLIDLDLSYNNIKNLTKGIFQDIKYLKVLNLFENNFIEYMENETFNNLYNLEELYLPKYLLINLPSNFFKGLIHLKHLDLSYTNLSNTILDELFMDLYNLELLNISNNQIYEFKYNYLYNSHNLKVLDISFNEIFNANFELAICTYNYNLQKIYLRNNTIPCKRLFEMLTRFNEMYISYDDLYLESPVCDNENYILKNQIKQRSYVRNLRATCEDMAGDIMNVSDYNETTTVMPSSTTSSTEGNSTSSPENNVKHIEIHTTYGLNLLSLFLILFVSIIFGALMYKVIRRGENTSNINSRKVYQYRFSRPQTDSRINLVIENDNENDLQNKFVNVQVL